jgi:hypothetical protein
MKRYEKIFEDHLKLSSVRTFDDISESEKHFYYEAMKEAAWQAWKLFTFRQREFFERWWEDDQCTNKRHEDWHE